MISINSKYLSYNQTERASVQVEEKIQTKFYDDFLKTSLLKNNIQIQKTSKILSSYISESMSYEIVLINSDTCNIILEFQVFEAYYVKYDLHDSQYDLFITDDYFTVYKDKKFYFVKDNNNYEQADILKYISFKCNINIENTYYINSQEKNLLKELYFSYFNNDTVLIYHAFVDKKTYHYYLSFLIIASLLYSIFIYKSQIQDDKQVTNDKNSELNELKRKYNNFLNTQNKKSLTQNTVKLFYYLKYHKINLVTFDYNKKLHILISSKKRDNLYKFLMEYKNNSKIIQLEKKETSKIYEMMVEIEI